MLKGIRWRLTALYLLAALILVALVSAGAYGLVRNYLQTATDQALQRKMARGFWSLNVPLPAALAGLEPDGVAPRPTLLPGLAESEGDNEGGLSVPHADDYRELHAIYDTDLAPIFLIAADVSGNLLPLPGVSTGLPADLAALRAAAAQGVDWRTITSNDGTHIRLLTYRLDQAGGAILQAGRSLADQDRILQRLLFGLLGLGGLSVVALGLASWWLAGKSLAPAQQAWERQQAFVANASHELRTPLTLLRASAEVTQRSLPAEDAERRELLSDVLQETDHMSRLVNDLLLLSRLDAGQLPLEMSTVPLAELLEDAQRQVGRLAEERGVRLCVGQANGRVHADAARLRQVLLIVLDNALRYTPPGGEIRMEAAQHGRHGQVTVSDTGPGIDPEHLPRLFERFYRADSARGRGTGGAGLGLAIARSLIEAQHGQIRVESAAGRGTRVTLTLPA